MRVSKGYFYSLFLRDKDSQIEVLWAESEIKKKSEIKADVLRQTKMFKVKGENIAQSKFFVLTATSIYYLLEEGSQEIQGEMKLNWVLVDFIRPPTFHALSRPTSVRKIGLTKRIDIPNNPDSPLRQAGSKSIRQPSIHAINFTKNFSRNDTAQKSRAKMKYELSYANFKNKTNTFAKMDSIRLKGSIGSMKYSENEEPHSGFNPNKMFIIRLVKGNLFSEIGTMNEAHFEAWRGYLKSVCISVDIQQEYTILDPLCAGRASKFYIALKKQNNERYVVKSMSKSLIINRPEKISEIKQTIDIMRDLVHFSIVRLFEVFEDERHLHFIFDLIKGPTILNTCELGFRYKDIEIRWFLRYLLEVLQFIHSKEIVHRNLSPRTVFLRNRGRPGFNSKIVIMSLSHSKRVPRGGFVSCEPVGNVGFEAPEVLNKEEEIDLYKSDVFSAGMILVYLMGGAHPYGSEQEEEIISLNKLHKMKAFNSQFLGYTPEIRNVVLSMIQRDPRARPTVKEILESKLFKNNAEVTFKSISKVKKFIRIVKSRIRKSASTEFKSNTEYYGYKKSMKKAGELIGLINSETVELQNIKGLLKRDSIFKKINYRPSLSSEVDKDSTPIKNISCFNPRTDKQIIPKSDPSNFFDTPIQQFYLQHSRKLSNKLDTRKMHSFKKSLSGLSLVFKKDDNITDSELEERGSIDTPKNFMARSNDLSVVSRNSQESLKSDIKRLTVAFNTKEPDMSEVRLGSRIRVPITPKRMKDLACPPPSVKASKVFLSKISQISNTSPSKNCQIF